MPRGKKTATAKTTKSSKGKTTRSAKVSASPAPVKAAPVEPAPVKAAPVEAAPEQSVSLFTPLFEKLSTLTQSFNETMTEGKKFSTEIRRLVSSVSKFEKKLNKQTRRRRTKTGKTTESGITRPVHVSDEMCKFLGEPVGTLLARTAVTKRITTYIREHNLQNPENRKQIFPDKGLQAMLVPLRKEDRPNGYTFFNLQRYLKHHYQKVEATQAKGVSVSATA